MVEEIRHEDQEKEEIETRRSMERLPEDKKLTDCNHCESQSSQKYLHMRNGNRRRSSSYEFLRHQESQCARV